MWCSSPIRRRNRSRPSSKGCPSSSSCSRGTAIRPTARPWSRPAASSTKNPEATARFVKASLEGWKSYLTDPAPGNALIKADNPKMSDEKIAFALEQLRALKVLVGGDAQTMGIGIITEARWKATYDFMVAAGFLKPEVDWKQGFTDRYVKSLKLSM